MIRLAVFDVDGTLFSHKELRVPASAVEAIKELRKQGIQIAIASGRPAHVLQNVIEAGIEFDYVVYSPGDLVNLDGRIEVSDDYDINGSYNLTYVTSRAGNIPNLVTSLFIKNWDIQSIDNMRVDNEDYDEILTRNKLLLKETSYAAIIPS